MLLDRVGRIAVLRANKLGDFLFALPALEALRVEVAPVLTDALDLLAAVPSREPELVR